MLIVKSKTILGNHVNTKVTVSIIVIFMFTPLSFISQATIINVDHTDYENEDLQIVKVWSEFEHAVYSSYDITESSGIIHSPFGSFNPEVDFIPLGPENLFDPFSFLRSGMAIVQSNSSNLIPLTKYLEGEPDVNIIDIIPDDAYLIRILGDDKIEMFEEIKKFSSVKWIGEFPIAWKVSKDLIPLIESLEGNIDLQIMTAPDLTPQELELLNIDLSLVSNDFIDRDVCDFSLCKLSSISPLLIPILAMDGRILKIEPSSSLNIHNNNARILSNIDEALSLSGGSLNGEGEVIAISDTGLDVDHGDFGTRLRNPVYNDFGPDNSGDDANSGHGTHVTATLLGDGSGDSKTIGVVPESTFIFYQLEVDSSGIFARWDSLYSMFAHAWDKDAKIQTNSWGSSNLLGEYTSDSHSADSYVKDQPKFLVLFSAGDEGSSGISSPGTAKNVLTVGASTTGAYSSIDSGSIYNFSSTGYTLDGRIKPDLVAPGVMICSARAAEASFTIGESCSTATHNDQITPLYMTLNGSSMSTSVVAGAAAMTRQYLREEVNISEPRSDLIKAILINGATDLGLSNIPNPSEGWGQLNLSQSLYPKSGDFDSDTIFDYSRSLSPGHSFLYTLQVTSGSTMDATLVWNDREGSVTGDQSISKLVNDLDLKITSPSGVIYNGNNFISGYSTPGGVSDNINNVERIKLDSAEEGIWSIEIGNSKGNIQQYSLVVSGIIEETFGSDLSIIPDSLSSFTSTPLQGDILSINAKWSNRASLPTGDYSISIHDLTTNDLIKSSQMASLEGGQIASLSFTHSFDTTGEHIIQLRLDSLSEVTEFNDELEGINNNIFNYSFNVSQIGVRIIPLFENGTIPNNLEELSDAKTRNLDPREDTSIDFKLQIINEGTSQITVDLSISPLQIISEQGILNQPQDEWWKILNESGPWILNPSGQEGDKYTVSLNLSNKDADITDNALARYSLPGDYVTDLTLFDKNAPTISHSIRLTTIVDTVEGLYTVVAGETDLSARPGEFGLFSLSIRNIGNGPTQYEVSCETANRWLIHIGNTESSELVLDPLNRLQFLPLPIRVKVPKSLDYQPIAGATEEIMCTTTSVSDSSIYTNEWAIITVLESKLFSTYLSDDEGNKFETVEIAEPRAVTNGDTISTNLVISNLGNVEISFEIQVLSSVNTWPLQVYESSESTPIGLTNSVSIVLSPSEYSSIIIKTIIPLSSQKGDMNTISIKTTSDEGILERSGTILIVEEIASLDLAELYDLDIALGMDGISEIEIKNTGNVPLDISISIGTVPNSWEVGFLSGNYFTMDMNREAVVQISISLPPNLEKGKLSDKVPVIIQATTPNGEIATYTVEISISVLPSIWITLESPIIQIEDIGINSDSFFDIILKNNGNTMTNVNIEFNQLEGWEISLDKTQINQISPGGEVRLLAGASPVSKSSSGLKQFTIFANSSSESMSITDSSLLLKVSMARETGNGGLSEFMEDAGLPSWVIPIIFILILMSLGFVGFNMRKSISINSDEELIPAGSALSSGNISERRNSALDTSLSGEALSGTVSQDEINAALSSSLPSLKHSSPGAPPLPLTGLPDGWTMEQWNAYGHMWWEKNKN